MGKAAIGQLRNRAHAVQRPCTKSRDWTARRLPTPATGVCREKVI